MEDKIRLSIISQEGDRFDRQVSYVNIPTSFGSVGVLSGHAPMLCAVAPGVLRVSFGEGETGRYQVGAGIANVEHNEVTVLAASARALD